MDLAKHVELTRDLCDFESDVSDNMILNWAIENADFLGIAGTVDSINHGLDYIIKTCM